MKYSIPSKKKCVRLFGTMYDQEQNIVKRIFNRGNSIANGQTNFKFLIILDERLSSYQNKKITDKIHVGSTRTGSLFVISDNCAKTLLDSGMENIELFDVEIKGTDFHLDGYKIVNILNQVKCVNTEESNVEVEDNGTISLIESLVLIDAKIPPEIKIFMLEEDPGGVMVVSDQFVQMVEDNNLSGFEFLSLDQAVMYS